MGTNYMEEVNERIVQIWLDDSYMEIELNQPKDWDEDKFYQEAVNYVLSNISVAILQERRYIYDSWSCFW